MDAKPLLKQTGVFTLLCDKAIFRNCLIAMNGTVAWDLDGTRDTSTCINLDFYGLYDNRSPCGPASRGNLSLTHNLTHDRKNPGGDSGENRGSVLPSPDRKVPNGDKSVLWIFRQDFGTMRPWVQIPPLGP